ncbi:MAG: T9SS type A sorting domain-containing protein [Bacteroidia bacterium]|nr:T9SS type A sorting domain-containing protein [Bacteroidia bacterium]
MLKVRKSLLFLICISVFSQIKISAQTPSSVNARTVALLDLTVRNAETSDGEIYSAKYILKTSGIPFIVTANVDSAKLFGMILASSKFDLTTFTVPEKDSLIAYVNNGGVLIAPNIKDPYFFSLFGISSSVQVTNHYSIKFNIFLNDASFKWLNDTMEQTISLGDTSYPSIINTRTYNASGALSLANYEDNSMAVGKRIYGAGTAYALGFSFKNLIVTNQMNRDYDAHRFYSNGFEPTSDAVVLFIKGIYLAHTKRSVWIHTSPYDSKTALMITHDVDATTAYDTMHYYADYENSIGLKASYFFTTHYIGDGLLSSFYNATSIVQVQYVLSKGHIAGSHSMGHFPDFDDETVFPIGVLGNQASTYLPFNSGSGSTVGGTVLGETEVSKELLESNFGISVKTFRAGYLCFNDKLINALDTLGYVNSTTQPAGDLLTNFPFQQRKDRSVSGELTNVWEFPMAISDVFASNPISSSNYPQKVATWLDVINRNMANNAPNVILIHPTRYYKLNAEQDLINGLPPGVFVTSLDWFADYWRYRNNVSFTSYLSNDSLTVIIPSALLPLDSSISFVVDSGQFLTSIKAQDEFGMPVSVIQSNFNTNDVIIHFANSPTLNNGWVNSNSENKIIVNCFPNPASENCVIEFRLDDPAKVKLEIFDLYGNALPTVVQNNFYSGWYKIPVSTRNLSSGIYFYRLSVNEKSVTKKLIISR